MSISYPNAESFSGDVVHIDETIGKPTPRPRYVCLSCRAPMAERHPQDARAHFYHVGGGQGCSVESYYHALAKKTFYDAYSGALAAGRPFLLRRRVTEVCNRQGRNRGVACEIPRVQEIDLTEFYEDVAIEEAYRGFRADVLLSSSRLRDPLFVEFVVAHPCEPEKIAAEIPIIEIHVGSSDESATSFEEGGLDDERHELRYYHLPFNLPAYDICQGRCDRPRAGGATVAHGEEGPNTGPQRKHRDWWQERTAARNMYQTGEPVLSCWVCRHHRKGDYVWPLRCASKGDLFRWDRGASCERFVKAGPGELRQLDVLNSQPIQVRRDPRK